MAKPLDTKKIAETATRIEALRAEILREEANLARLCGVVTPEGDAPKARKPRRSRTNVEVLGAGVTGPVGAAQTQPVMMRELTPEEIAERDKTAVKVAPAEEMPRHDPDRTDPAHLTAAEIEDRAADIPPFLRRGGNMTDAEKVAAAEKALES